MRPEPLRHSLIFYYGHTAAFYFNKLVDNGIIKQGLPHYECMYAVGVGEMDWDDLNKNHYDWPSVPNTRTYRANSGWCFQDGHWMR